MKTVQGYIAERSSRDPEFAEEVARLRQPLDCDALRAAFALDTDRYGCCVPCHREANPRNDWGIYAPLDEGELTDGRRFRCCCQVREGLVERGVVA